jgi:hypothetical protein
VVQSLPLVHGPHAVLTHVELRNYSLESEFEVLIAVSKKCTSTIRYFTDVSEKITLSIFRLEE